VVPRTAIRTRPPRRGFAVPVALSIIVGAAGAIFCCLGCFVTVPAACIAVAFCTETRRANQSPGRRAAFWWPRRAPIGQRLDHQAPIADTRVRPALASVGEEDSEDRDDDEGRQRESKSDPRASVPPPRRVLPAQHPDQKLMILARSTAHCATIDPHLRVAYGHSGGMARARKSGQHACMWGRLTVLAFICMALSGCGSSSKPGSSSPTTSTTTTILRPCGSSEEGCTSAQVIATVERLYRKAGATPAEAGCLAPITGNGKSQVNQAFDVPQPGEEAAAIKCAGSEARLRIITAALAAYFEQHPSG
jgi:hypothetical protein